MDTYTVILVALLPILLAASAVCSGSETALFSLTHADRARLRRENPGVHVAVSRLLASPRAFLVAVLLGNVTVNSVYFVAASMAEQRMSGVVRPFFVVAVLLLMITCGEVLPKSLAAAHRVTLCRVFAKPASWWFLLISPVRRFSERYLIAPITRLLRPRRPGTGAGVSADELAALLEAGGREGVLHEGEQRLLADVVRLSAVRVREIMTPRTDIDWIDATATVQDLLAKVKKTGHTRFPVCRGELDEITVAGFVSAQRVIPLLNRDSKALSRPINQVMEPVRFVPDKARLDQLLEQFRQTKSDAILCVNELGDLTGLVEIDAVIGELVGVTTDGSQVDTPQVRMVALGTWEVPGRLGVRDWVDFFGGSGATADARVATVAGLIFVKLGRVPKVGDECQLGNLTLRVEAMDGRDIQRVRVSIKRPAQEAAA